MHQYFLVTMNPINKVNDLNFNPSPWTSHWSPLVYWANPKMNSSESDLESFNLFKFENNNKKYTEKCFKRTINIMHKILKIIIQKTNILLTSPWTVAVSASPICSRFFNIFFFSIFSLLIEWKNKLSNDIFMFRFFIFSQKN